MKSKNLIVVFFLLSQQIILAQDYSYKPKYSTILDSTKGSITIKQCSRMWPQGVKKFWNPNQSEIDSVEKNFKKVLEIEEEFSRHTVTHFESYGFQYVGIKIKKKKYIYINAFYIPSEEYLVKHYDYWKDSPVTACDGGSSFWGVIYNIENSKFEQLAINGR